MDWKHDFKTKIMRAYVIGCVYLILSLQVNLYLGCILFPAMTFKSLY